VQKYAVQYQPSSVINESISNASQVLYRNLKVGVLEDGKGVLPWRDPGQSPEIGVSIKNWG
jgi:hypothetical protein